jgi:hypothetical protein
MKKGNLINQRQGDREVGKHTHTLSFWGTKGDQRGCGVWKSTRKQRNKYTFVAARSRYAIMGKV